MQGEFALMDEPPLNLPTLYDYQEESIRQLRRAIREGRRRLVLSSPTGSGKTEIAKAMIAGALRKGSRALFVVDRLTLLDQTSRRFAEAGIEHGLIGGGVTRGGGRQILVGMIQTIARQGWPGDLKVIFVDECHTRYQYLTDTIEDLPCPVIGLTATPMVEGLGRIYEDMVQVTNTDRLIEDGRLCPIRVKAAVPIDMEGVAPVGGEWTAESVRERGAQVIGDIVTTWQQETQAAFGGPVKTMLFSASIAHGRELCDAFRQAGFDFRQVTGYDDNEERDQVMADFRAGKFVGVASVEALAKGIDLPDVKCLIVARPFRRAFSAHVQMLGRIMRTAPGKEFGLVLDHSLNYLGFQAQTERFFAEGAPPLSEGEPEKHTRDARPKSDRACPKCRTIRPIGERKCPACGHVTQAPNDVRTVAGSMISIDRSRGAPGWNGSESELWTACCTNARKIATRRGDVDDARALKIARAQFKGIAGRWPDWAWRFSPSSSGRVPKAVRLAAQRDYDRYVRRRR